MNMSSAIKYIAIADWMLEYKLNVRELLTFSIIYGFTQDNKQWYGSLDTIAEWIGINPKCSNNVLRYIEPLVKKKLLNKQVVFVNKTKRCIYQATVNKGPVVDNPDVDFINIQPWMITDYGLKGKDLILFALIYSYSRRGSGNYCKHIESYFHKWLCVRKDHIDRQIKRLKDKKLIETFNDGYIAVLSENIVKRNASQSDNLLTQSDNLLPQTDNQNSPKVIGNNSKLHNLSNNLLLNNNVVEEKNELKDKVAKYFETVLVDSENFSNAFKAKDQKSFIDTMVKFVSLVKNQKKEKLQRCLKLSNKQILNLFLNAENAYDNFQNTFKNPDGYIISKLNKLLEDVN